ncbi:hypothetical protein [uncultured Prevotella sp.]|uniref:hypothetical protein n=1 Tax=uncultured Prevotella sp. TaxID=159272 RepID=UPI002608742F|nr:hypothetical protein [uncultured Prevotella sp.]
MEEEQQNQNRNEKPRYYATDFNEIKENLSDEEKLLFERYKEMLSGIIPADTASSSPSNDASSSSSSPSNDAASFKALLNQLKDISQKTMKQMARGKLDIPVTCPKCGKRHCYIKVDNGLTHCWSCNWSGYLEEMKSLLGKGSGKVNGNYYANAQKKQQDEHKAKDYVPMLPDDFLEIDAETRSWLYPIYPFKTQEEQQQFIDHFHPANLLSHHPKARPLITAPELASLQSMVQRYIQAMKLSPDIIIQEGVMCAWMKQNADDTKSEDPKGVEMVPAIAYCNYLDGKIINVKFRSVQQHPITGEWSKLFCQVSPTKTCGFPYVLSIANGASTNIEESHEAFPPLDIYSVAGSAQWANLADFLLTVNRISKPEEGKMFTIVEMLKVRDQEFCHPGKVYYVRQPCGRYDERESENDCIAEAMQGKVLAKDDEPWKGMLNDEC